MYNEGGGCRMMKGERQKKGKKEVGSTGTRVGGKKEKIVKGRTY